jgi:hypothetical protein
MIANRHAAILAVATIAAIGSAISTLEWISNRRQLQDGGLFGWQVVGSRSLVVGTRLRARLLDRSLRYRPYVIILSIRLAAVLCLPVAILLGRKPLVVSVLAIVVATTLLMNFRSIYGMDGSDQMTTQIYAALLLGFAAGTALSLDAALWYIALQSCFSYFTSGFAKIISPQWRKGANVFRIFNTRTYGYEPVARSLRGRPRLTRFLDWSAFIVEMAFPLSLLVGFPGVLLFVAWGVIFHIMNAVVMGLNSFLWAFTATYPAVIYVALVIAHWRG